MNTGTSEHVTPDAHAHGAIGRKVAALLAAVGALGSLAIHMVVPALPLAARDLHVPAQTMQATISLYLLGLGAGQFVAGPLSDRLGRRPVLLGGVALFVAASLWICVAPSAVWLLGARFVEALGAAATLVAARALVADLSGPHEAPAQLAALTGVILLSPTLAPTIGGILASIGGWRLIFVILSAAGIGFGLLGLAFLPAAAPRPRRATLIEAYRRLARNARYRRFVLANAFASSALYIFLGGSAFLLIGRYGLTPARAGLCYLLVSGCGVAGTVLVRRLGRRHDILITGLAVILAGAAIMTALAWSGADSAAALTGPMLVVGLGAGLAGPAGIAGAMHAEDGLAGTASSLAGTTQMLASAAITAAMGAIGIASLRALATAILTAAIAAWLAAPRRG